MKLRKLASLCLAGAMALAVAVPSFAAAGDNGDLADATDGLNGSLTIEGSTEAPTLSVTIPAYQDVGTILNPYKMTVDATAIGGSDKESGQLISATYFAENHTAANVKVKVEGKVAKGSSAGDVEFATKPVATMKEADLNGKNTVFIYLDTAIASKSGEKIAWPAFGSKATDTQLVLGATDEAVKTEYVLAAGTKDTTTPTTINLAKNGGCLAFKLNGDCNGNPTVAWTENDTVDVTLTFTLTITSDISTYEANQAAAAG